MKTRRIMAGLCLACCLAASAAAQGTPAAKADFSGTWVLDASKSEGLPPGVEQKLVVTQQGDRVEAQNTTKGPQGEQVIKDAYVLDGQETDFAMNQFAILFEGRVPMGGLGSNSLTQNL